MELHLTPVIAERLSNSKYRIVVTGAGGWLGLATLEMLRNALKSDFGGRVVCFGSAARVLTLRGWTVDQFPLEALADLPSSPTLVLHLAFLTKDRAEAMTAEDYRTANKAVRRRVLDALEPIGAQGFFLPSSGAAREAENPDAPAAMKLYGALKREDEDAFGEWAERRLRACAIARVFNVSGPYINKHGNYALASFIADALAGRPVKVRATHPVVRSYVAIRELMSIVFAHLLDEHSAIRRFDTAGGEMLEVRQIAQLAAELLGSGVVEAPPIERDAPADIYVGEPAGYNAARLFAGVESVLFKTQILETAAYMAAIQG